MFGETHPLFHTRPDKGDGETPPQFGEHERGGRVAGDDHEVGLVLADQPADDGDDAFGERRLRPAAIRKGGVVGRIDEAGVGPGGRDFAVDRQAAETGIEDEDGGRLGHGRIFTRRRTTKDKVA